MIHNLMCKQQEEPDASCNAVRKCHHCGTLVSIGTLHKGEDALCPFCHSLVRAGSTFDYLQLFCLSLTAFIFLLISLPFQFLMLDSNGDETIISLIDSVQSIYARDHAFLAVVVFFVVILIPILTIGSSMGIFAILYFRRFVSLFPSFFRVYRMATHWMMVEVFLIGVLVSLIKVVSLANVHLGVSFYLYGVFVVISLITMTRIDIATLWNSWDQLRPSNMRNYEESIVADSFESELVSCAYCGFLSCGFKYNKCPRCHSKRTLPGHARINNTIALLITAALLYIPANMLPVMSTFYFGEPTHSTILQGIITFLHHEDYFIAAIIFLASVFIPLAKILALAYLCLCVRFQRYDFASQKTRLYKLVEALGKWSMIDVFVVVIMVTLIQVGNVIFIRSGPGIIAFAGVVVATLFAAQQFDPKLIWNSGSVEIKTNHLSHDKRGNH